MSTKWQIPVQLDPNNLYVDRQYSSDSSSFYSKSTTLKPEIKQHNEKKAEELNM